MTPCSFVTYHVRGCHAIPPQKTCVYIREKSINCLKMTPGKKKFHVNINNDSLLGNQN